MTYRVEQDFRRGVPQTILPRPLAPTGIACHWTAGAPGEAGALGTIQFFIDRRDRNASYGELWWWDGRSGTFGVIEVVPGDRASHSLNPNRPPWEPNAEVRRILGARVWDPNAACYSISFAGMPADLAVAMADPAFVRYAARRIGELVGRYRASLADRPLFNHGWGQPSSRSDAGDRLIPAIYAALAAKEDDMPTPDREYVPQLWHVKPGGAEVREQADLSAPVVARIAEGTEVFSVGEDAAPPTAREFRDCVVVIDGVRRLRFLRRDQLDDVGDGRDPLLDAGINAVIAARLAGEPPPSGEADCDGAIVQAEQETTARVNQEWREWLATAPAAASK